LVLIRNGDSRAHVEIGGQGEAAVPVA